MVVVQTWIHSPTTRDYCIHLGVGLDLGRQCRVLIEHCLGLKLGGGGGLLERRHLRREGLLHLGLGLPYHLIGPLLLLLRLRLQRRLGRRRLVGFRPLGRRRRLGARSVRMCGGCERGRRLFIGLGRMVGKCVE